MKRLFLCLATLVCLVAGPALAQQRVMIHLSSGTGFFINRQGKIITNAHVVKACQSIVVHVPQGDLPATIAARDEQRDLAILQVNSNEVPAMASLRWNISDLRLGDAVALLGYPGQEGAQGHASFVKSKVLGLVGPNGEPGFLQLQSAAEHGNSGGPVLDSTGNVIAVITGKAKVFRADDQGQPTGDPIKQVDVAITLSALQDFLQQHQVSFYQATSSGAGYGDSLLEQNAAKFIVPIRCIQGTSPATNF